ncbi:MAG: hypothetical protein M0Z66_05240 [Thermaerobacter sp.]|nr:hypothetical protein [Thermaerobacter sp.]
MERWFRVGGSVFVIAIVASVMEVVGTAALLLGATSPALMLAGAAFGLVEMFSA